MKVKFGIYFVQNIKKEDAEVKVVLYATNSVTAQGVTKFQDFLTELLACDPEELYVTQVEKSLEADDSEAFPDNQFGTGMVSNLARRS